MPTSCFLPLCDGPICACLHRSLLAPGFVIWFQRPPFPYLQISLHPRSSLPRSIKTMRGLCLLPDALYTLVVAVLRACGGVSADVPAALPAAMAARHRACTALAAAVREAGYAADMGYNQLLYPNERDT